MVFIDPGLSLGGCTSSWGVAHMTRYGTVLVFRAGVSREEIDVAMQGLEGVLDSRYFLDGESPRQVPYRVEEFDDDVGVGPVWYIP